MCIVYAVVQDSHGEILYNGARSATGTIAVTQKSALLGLAEYKSAVLVGNASLSAENSKDNKYGVCESEAKVRAFMRMLRVKEGTSGEIGYKKLFGHKDFTQAPYNKGFSTHPQIYIPFGKDSSSSASGAYQIMYDTFKWSHGYYKKEEIWHYVEGNDLAKKYNITSFNQESQDKLCLVILKHGYKSPRPHEFFYKEDGSSRHNREKFKTAYGDIIEMIINDNFDKAVLTSSLCWASLPDAPYGQPKGTKAEVLASYKRFLSEELKGISDLHLKKGFLKEFKYSCCDGKDSSSSKGCGGKINVDLSTKLTFAAQTTGSNCTESCKKIVRQLGIEPEGATERSKVVSGLRESYYQLVDERSDKTDLVFHPDKIKLGMEYLDKALDAGYAVVVGVNHTLKYRKHGIINEDTTDHYVVIVGRVCVNDQLYYQFWDVGSRNGDNMEYKFKLSYDNKLISEKNYRSDGKAYTVTQIRRNFKNNKLV